MQKFLLTALFLCSLVYAKAQGSNSPILFIYDASGSMWGELAGKTKKEIASDVLASTVGKLPENQPIGLIAYGHRTKGDCDDIEYLVELSNRSKTNITKAVEGINPIGKTPLARSATMAINSLKANQTKATLILITDGIESCDGDLCKVVAEAKASGIDFKLHIVGFGLKDGEKEQLKCAAKAGDGNYYDAMDAAALNDGLTEATTQTVDKPAANFSVYALKNGQPVDAWVRPTNTATKKELDGARTYRDTARVYLPAGKYEIEVKPLEDSDIPATTILVELKEGEVKHQDVSFDGGKLEVSTTNNGEPWDAMVKVLDKTTGKVVSSTRTYARSKQMEVPAGHYKVTYQALTIEGIDINFEVADVEVKPATTTPISHNFKSGIA
ncbi:MAG: VWA domain-containing protein, partial [Phaeodactylibacter sp.]|nr:VWA domain-containing protein [Phaeodactylibacter sp.]